MKRWAVTVGLRCAIGATRGTPESLQQHGSSWRYRPSPLQVNRCPCLSRVIPAAFICSAGVRETRNRRGDHDGPAGWRVFQNPVFLTWLEPPRLGKTKSVFPRSHLTAATRRRSCAGKAPKETRRQASPYKRHHRTESDKIAAASQLREG
jgi:hypothetical protein